jgi:AraC-like DNA-binding protein
MSESHLRSRFREETGLSIGRYLRETRLRRAANWLKEEGLSVKSVSERAGYPDIHTFSRSFSRLFGHPPSVMR